MRISLLLPQLRLYGGIRRMLEIANQLVSLGHEIVIYHSDGSQCDWMKVNARILPYRKIFDLEHDNLVYIFPEQFYDVKKIKTKKLIHYNLNLYNKTLLRLPTSVLFMLKRVFAYNRAYYIKKAVTDRSARILVNCIDSKKWLLKNFKIESDAVLGAVDSNIYYCINSPDKHKKPVILYLGSPKYWKGSNDVKKAFEIIKKEILEAKLESFYDKGVPQSEMAKVYARASVFVDAQIYAGWNNPVAEAMACKVPVVCYDIGPNRDVAMNEKTALLVKPQKPELLAQSVIRLLNDRMLSEQLAENAYNNIKQYTWQKTSIDFLTAISNAKS